MKETLFPAVPILLVDDEKSWLCSLELMMERLAGINNTISCQDSRDVPAILHSREISLILLDYTMPHLSGEELLATIREEYPHVPVIILTGRDQVDIAVRCMKLGAFDYFIKTTEEERLIAGIQRAIRMQELQVENLRLKENILREDRLDHPDAFAAIVAQSKTMKSIFRYVEAVAGSNQPVLITGENGTGKELVARAISAIAKPEGPWVAINLAGLDDDMILDTLFGHLKGAFTGAEQLRSGMVEQAAGGTLFLDEVGTLSMSSQLKLLRLLQDGEYFPIGSDRPKRANARIVVATNEDLAAKQLSGEFRKDLFYRLRTHHVHLPPLRERQEDIPLLLEHFLAMAARELGKRKPTPPQELSLLLASYHFPGNVRELRAMVYDAVSVHQSKKLSMDSFKRAMGRLDETAEHLSHAEAGDGHGSHIVFGEKLPTIKEAVNALLHEALVRSGGNQGIMASLLGISRPALNKRLKNRQE